MRKSALNASEQGTRGTTTSVHGQRAPQPLDPKGLVEELRESSELGNRGEWWFAAQAAAIFAVVVPPWGIQGLVDVLGPLLLVAGFTLMVLGQQGLGNYLSPLPAPRSEHDLVTTGVYGYVRHPMYGGLILAGLGLAATTHDEGRLLLVALLWWTLEQKVVFEERKLIERYPTQYEDYKRKTKKLIPYLL